MTVLSVCLHPRRDWEPMAGKTAKPNVTILWTRVASRTQTSLVWLWCCSLGFWCPTPCSLVVGVALGTDHLCVLFNGQGCVHKSSLVFRWVFTHFPGEKHLSVAGDRNSFQEHREKNRLHAGLILTAPLETQVGFCLPCLLSPLGKNWPDIFSYHDCSNFDSLLRSVTEEKMLMGLIFVPVPKGNSSSLCSWLALLRKGRLI